MSSRGIGTLVVALAALLLFNSAYYEVSETSQVIVTQFGNPIGAPVTTPGLHLKDLVHPAGQLLRQAVSRVGRQPEPGADEGQALIWVDTYARWRIVDPLKILSAASRRARRPVAPRRHPRRRDPEFGGALQPD